MHVIPSPSQTLPATWRSPRKLTVDLFPSSNLVACVHMALEGLGVCTIPAVMVTSELAGMNLYKSIIAGFPPPSLQFRVCFDSGRVSLIIERVAKIALEVSSDFDQRG